MPTYEYECADCGHRFEIRASFSEKDKGLDPRCPRCGSDNVGQVFGGLLFFAKTGEVSTRSAGGCGCSACS